MREVDDDSRKQEHEERVGMGFGAMPGMNQMPINPSFRDLDAPGGVPTVKPWWITLTTVVVGIGVVAFIIFR